MLNITYFIISFLLCGLAITLAIILLHKERLLNQAKKSIENLEKIKEEFKQQTKLIIESDLELKLSQNNMEDKTNQLAVIKNLIYSSIYTLDKQKLLEQIDEKIINNLGFTKAAILSYIDHNVNINIGFNPNQLETIRKIIINNKTLFFSDSDTKNLEQILETTDFLISPIKVNNQIHVVLLLANLLPSIKKPNPEVISIICNYLSQCLYNIELFEDLYHTKDDLEMGIKERTNELLKSIKNAENISKLKSNFISSVSHELRTPLTSIKGFSALLVEEKFGVLPPEAKQRLQRIDENVDKLVNMVNTLLDIAHIESGKMELKIVPYSIGQLSKDVCEFLSPQTQAKEIKIILEIPKNILVYMDKHLIERVLINLINNAIKFAPQKSEIMIKCFKEGNNLVTSVTDKGPGIPETDQENIFQEFFRANNAITAKIKGTGLGLALVKHIIDLHGGKIWFSSQENQETTFYFSLKLV